MPRSRYWWTTLLLLLLLPLGGVAQDAASDDDTPAVADTAGAVAPALPDAAVTSAGATAAIASTTAAAATSAVSAADDQALALHVLQRLGYGPRPGDVKRVAAQGVDRYIEDQLHPERLFEPGGLTDALAALPSWPMGWAERYKKLGPPALDAALSSADGASAVRAQAATVLHEDQTARVLMALESARQLQEVLVEFWFDHFNIDASKGFGHFWASSYEREAIRPHVLGHFRELLEATASSPAMLAYLGNWRNSVPGTAADGTARGANDAYARVLLADHTLGRGSGYTGRDIVDLARILTGWTFEPRLLVMGVDHAFHYDYRLHDNNEKVFRHHHLYGVFGDAGISEGRRALTWLALDPITAQRISRQLAHRFLGFEPPQALLEAMTSRWYETDGDLREVLEVLFKSREFRDPARFGTQAKTAYAYVISAVRAGGLHPQRVDALIETLSALGAAPYSCAAAGGCEPMVPAPLGDAALARRDAFAEALAAGTLPLAATEAGDPAPIGPLDPARLAGSLGPGLSAATEQALANAPPSARAALLLRSGDFTHR